MKLKMFHRMFSPVLPGSLSLSSGGSEQDVILTVLIAVAFAGAAVLIGWILTKIMRARGMKCSTAVDLAVPGTVALASFLLFGCTVTAVQGVFLCFLLLYASCSDLTDHHMDDSIWVAVLALGLASVGRFGFSSMLVGAVMVFVPQMLISLLPKGKPLGGADIKLSAALAFLLGWKRGLGTLILGLLTAVLVMAVVQKVKPQYRNKPFALIPFLSGAATVMFLL